MPRAISLLLAARRSTVAWTVATLFGAGAAVAGYAKAPSWLLISLGAVAIVASFLAVWWTLVAHPDPRREAAARREDSFHSHFAAKGRGVLRRTEQGRYFEGRRLALADLADWLGSPGGGLCVVTGDPGSGKSAVLGRLQLLSRGEADSDDLARAFPRAIVSVAVHAKGRTMYEVIGDIADALELNAKTPDQLIDVIAERKGRTVVLVDALDEAAIGEAGQIARELLKPLVAQGDPLSGAKVLAGTRRWTDLLADLGEPSGSSMNV